MVCITIIQCNSVFIKYTTVLITQIARNVQEDIDLHDYEEVDNETDIETKECAAYAIQKKVDLESNPAYIYAQIGDQAITVEMKECVAYSTQDTVTTEASPVYQTVTEHQSCDIESNLVVSYPGFKESGK